MMFMSSLRKKIKNGVNHVGLREKEYNETFIFVVGAVVDSQNQFMSSEVVFARANTLTRGRSEAARAGEKTSLLSLARQYRTIQAA